MEESIKPVGVVLCGGESSRMGANKSLLNYHGKTQREHVRELLSPFCSPVVYSTGKNDEQLEEAFPDLPDLAGNGPLSGLLSLHYFFPDRDLLVTGCDYPLILQSQLLALIPESATQLDAICYVSGSFPRPEPLLAWYSASFCESIRKAFETEGSNSLRKFLEGVNIRYLSVENPIHLTSVDHPEDAIRVRQIIQQGFDTFV